MHDRMAAPTKPRILCVDDEPMVLEGLRDSLRRSFDVRVATSGADGLALLSENRRDYAVVISDMRMPVMSGSVFLREARRVAPLAVRMLLTGYADTGRRGRGRQRRPDLPLPDQALRPRRADPRLRRARSGSTACWPPSATCSSRRCTAASRR